MKEKTSDYRLPKEASLLSNHLTRFRRMLNNRLFGPEPRPVLREEEYFYSNSELADFMNCSPSTTRRYRHRGLIKSTRHGQCVLTHIPTLLNTVAQDDRLSAMFLRRTRPRRPKKALVIRYSCTLEGGYLFADIRFCGWKGTFICKASNYRSEQFLEDTIRKIVTVRHSYKPFKTLSYEKN